MFGPDDYIYCYTFTFQNKFVYFYATEEKYAREQFKTAFGVEAGILVKRESL